MSEDVRKNLRTQGKYNDGKVRKSLDKKQRDGLAAKDSLETRLPKRNSDESVSSVKYEENSDYTFDQFAEVAKPEEIKSRIELVLSETENGKSRILYEPQFLHNDEGNDYFDRLHATINWNTKNIVIHGVEYPQPRLVAWFGPFPYSYSGTTLEPAEMPDAVMEIKEKVEKYLACNDIKATFNSVLINLYRDGKDSVAWHSDDELMLGISPTIASVSLGEIRKFEIRPKKRSYDDQSPSNQTCKYFVRLTHGSLIIMTGSMQDDWQHRVPKEYHDKKPRINLTFRTVYPLEKAPGYVPVKEINLETDKKQSYGRNIPNKPSNSEFKLDDEHFPSLQKDVISSKSRGTCGMYDSHKNLNPNFKRNVTTEECWDNEISDNKHNAENIITHKNSSVFNIKDEDCKSKYTKKNNFNNRKPPEKCHDVESKYDNVKAFDDKTVTKKLWYDEHSSSVISTNENQSNNFYKDIDQNKVYDREASLTVNVSQQNVTNQEERSVKPCNIKTTSCINVSQDDDLDNEKPQNALHYVEDKSWVDSSEENNLGMKTPSKMALNMDGIGCNNSYINVTGEDNFDNEKSLNAYHYVGGYSCVDSSEKTNFDVKKPIKKALNVDAKEFVPFNIKSNEVTEYSDLKLENLINIHINSLEGKSLQDFAQSLKKRIVERFHCCNHFDRSELEFLLEITDGSQIDKNQRLISNRTCRIVQNNFHNFLKNRLPFDRSPRQRGYENQGHYSDKGRRYPNQNRNSKNNPNRY